MVPDFEVKAGDRWFHQCVGIDIAKEKFDACLFMYDTGSDMGCCTQSVQFPNNKTGFNQLVKWSRKEALKDFPLTFLMEPTGVYYEPVAYHLHKVGMTVYVVLPNKARHFAEYLGIKTKTDEMDARCLALLGCANQRLQPWTPPIPIYRELRQLCRFAADMNKLRTMLNNHLEALQHSECPEPSVVKHYKSMIDVVDRKLVLRQISCCQVKQVWKILIQRSRSEARPYILLLIYFILLFRPSISPLLIEYFMAFLMGEMSRWTLFTKLTTSP